MKSIGMPLSFAELGAKEEDIPTMVKTMGLGEDGTIGGFVSLGNRDIEAIYRLAL